MKIEEVVSIYEFLSNVSWIGMFGVILLFVSTLFSSFFLFGKDKEKIEINKRWIALSILFVVLITLSVTLLKIEADNRRDKLIFANCAKTEFVISGCKVLKDVDILQLDCKLLGGNVDDLLNTFPTEFIRVRTDDAESAIRIIDPASLAKIDNYNVVHLPFIKSRILEYLTQNPCETLSYFNVRKKIDDYFDDEWIELMVSKYDSIFAPGRDSSSASELYSKNHWITLTKEYRIKENLCSQKEKKKKNLKH
jgi:hypothetical protein